MLRLQHRPGAAELSLLGGRQGGEQDHRLARHVALAVALEQTERTFRSPRGEGGQCRKQQHLGIGRPRPQAFLRDHKHLR